MLTRWGGGSPGAALRLALPLVAALVITVAPMGASPAGPARAATGPIQHVVVIYQENHSFDNILGRWCVQSGRCDGVTTGRLHDGTTIPLSKASDLVAHVDHSREAQTTAIEGGAMDGFDLLLGCDQTAGYACYSQYTPKQIPNVIALARSFAVSDATFETSLAASWASHLSLVSSTPDLFWGDNPQTSQFHKPGPGWGCDSFQDALWGPNAQSLQTVPACVPDQNGEGPYRSSPVAYVPTIMDRLDAAGLSWKLYAGGGPTQRSKSSGYIWEVCPTFAECLNGPQKADWTAASQVVADATSGTLPNVSFVTPTPVNSQHDPNSMLGGDNWIGSVVSAIERGPDWGSTAIFITWDDCGCFYDHVNPLQYNSHWGIRVPTVIVSPLSGCAMSIAGTRRRRRTKPRAGSHSVR